MAQLHKEQGKEAQGSVLSPSRPHPLPWRSIRCLPQELHRARARCAQGQVSANWLLAAGWRLCCPATHSMKGRAPPAPFTEAWTLTRASWSAAGLCAGNLSQGSEAGLPEPDRALLPGQVA